MALSSDQGGAKNSLAWTTPATGETGHLIPDGLKSRIETEEEVLRDLTEAKPSRRLTEHPALRRATALRRVMRRPTGEIGKHRPGFARGVARISIYNQSKYF